MFYGNTLSTESVDNIDELYNTLIIEETNFNVIMSSINNLNENGVLLEINVGAITERVGKIIQGIKKFVKACLSKVVSLIKKFKLSINNDLIKPVDIFTPTTEFLDTVNNKLIPASDHIIDIIKYINNISSCNDDFDSEVEKINDILKNDIEGSLKAFGDTEDADFFGNDRCFTKSETISFVELKKALDNNNDIRDKIGKSIDKLSKAVDSLEVRGKEWKNSGYQHRMDEFHGGEKGATDKKYGIADLLIETSFSIRTYCKLMLYVVKAFTKAGGQIPRQYIN